MTILVLWQKPTWQDFPSTLLEVTDVCVFIGDGVLAAVLQTEKPILSCPLFALGQDLNARQITLQSDITIIDDAEWLQLILAHSKVVTF